MSESTVPADENSSRLDAIISAYDEAVDRGLSPPDPLEWAGPPSGIGPRAWPSSSRARLGWVGSPHPRNESFDAENPSRWERTRSSWTTWKGQARRSKLRSGGKAPITAPRRWRRRSTNGPALGTIAGSVRTLVRLGDFELIQPLGRGAMGVVYERTQLSLNRLVAIKTIRAASSRPRPRSSGSATRPRPSRSSTTRGSCQNPRSGQDRGLPLLQYEATPRAGAWPTAWRPSAPIRRPRCWS